MMSTGACPSFVANIANLVKITYANSANLQKMNDILKIFMVTVWLTETLSGYIFMLNLGFES